MLRVSDGCDLSVALLPDARTRAGQARCQNYQAKEAISL
jgi:hypothetical protein